MIYPERSLSLGRFDFNPAHIEEALAMPHREQVVTLPAVDEGATHDAQRTRAGGASGW